MHTAFRLLAVFASRGISALGGMLFSIAVARITGPSALGQIAVFMGVLGIGAQIACRGQDMILLRAAAHEADPVTGKSHTDLLRASFRKIALSTVIGGAAGAALLHSALLGAMMPNADVVLMVAMPIYCALALVSAYYKGADRAWFAPMFEIGGISLVASPILLLARLGLPINPLAALAIAIALLAIVAAAMVASDRFKERDGPEYHLDPGLLGSGQIDFMLIGLATFAMQAGAFTFVGPFLSSDVIGRLRAAERFAAVITFPQAAVSPFIAPRIVRARRDSDKQQLRRVTTLALLVSGAAGALPCAAMVLAPDHFLALMGRGFSDSVSYLMVLALVNLGVVICMPLNMVLAMGGNERTAMWINLFALSGVVLLYPSLSYLFGATGFLIAYGVVLLGRAGAMAVATFRRNGALSSV